MDHRHDSLTRQILASVIEVHTVLGSGFVEKIYKRALAAELRMRNFQVAEEQRVRITYKNLLMGVHRLDLVVEDQVVVEAKTVHELTPHHYDQVRSYLHATGLRVALLVNFAPRLAEWRRIER